MNTFYIDLPQIDVDRYTTYFLNKFIPGTKFFDTCARTYKGYTNLTEFPEIMELEADLIQRFNFPKFKYMNIFWHRQPQGVHSDGNIKDYINVSLNLPLQGYQNTEMVWYRLNNEHVLPVMGNEYGYHKDSVTPIQRVSGNNRWVLVNSQIPHNIVGSEPSNPRITACLRFMGNPTIEDMISLIRKSEQ